MDIFKCICDKFNMLSTVLVLFFSRFVLSRNSCLNFDVSITQKVENEGFHRELKWLVEMSSLKVQQLNETDCKLALRLDVPAGMYVNPDEIAEIQRLQQFETYIEGDVNIETPSHESKEYPFYIFMPQSQKIAINFPIHLRYQRAQITGGYGKVQLWKPSLLVKCGKDVEICGSNKNVYAPCNVDAKNVCMWKNVTYEVLFDDVELYVPIGDQDDYPLVSIVTLLLGCAGTVYILSILSTAPL